MQSAFSSSAAPARNLTFLRQNIKWSIIFLTNSTFERNLVSTHHQQIGEKREAAEKKTCQKVGFFGSKSSVI